MFRINTSSPSPKAASSTDAKARTLGALVLGAAALVPSARAQEAADQAAAKGEALRIALVPGTEAFFKVSIDRSQNMDMGIQKMSIGTKLNWLFSATPQPAEDGAETMPVRFRVVAVHGSLDLPMGMGNSKFDSRVEGDKDDIGGAVTSIVGTEFNATVTSRGKAVVVDDLAEVFDEARTSVGGMAAGMLMGILNEGMLSQMAGSVFPTLPEEPKAVGDTWDGSPEISADTGPILFKLDFTLSKLTDAMARIEGKGTVETFSMSDDDLPEGMDPELADEMRAQAEALNIEGGTNIGFMVWSRKDGMMTESRRESSFNMTTEGPMGEVKVSQSETVSLTRATAADGEAPKKAQAADKGK